MPRISTPHVPIHTAISSYIDSSLSVEALSVDGVIDFLPFQKVHSSLGSEVRLIYIIEWFNYPSTGSLIGQDLDQLLSFCGSAGFAVVCFSQCCSNLGSPSSRPTRLLG